MPSWQLGRKKTVVARPLLQRRTVLFHVLEALVFILPFFFFQRISITHRMAASSPFTVTGTLNASTFSMTNTYDLPSPPPHSHPSSTPRSSQITSDEEDQIVWYVSEGDLSSTSAELHEDLAKPQSDLLTSVEDEPLEQQTPVSATKPLEMHMSTLNLGSKANAKKKAKKFKQSKKATASSIQSQQRNSRNSAGLVSDAYSSPAQSPKPADVLQVLFVPSSRTNPTTHSSQGDLSNRTFRSWSTAHCR